MNNEWTTCVNLRKKKRQQRFSERDMCSHLVVRFEKAQQLQRKLKNVAKYGSS
uniref:Uncharacterized protein n=1 Tax=Marseillevirus LCMAC201 TaxID=2506605 RepID=A0A481YWU4_9VIRU|nr:MAG: hypothetical protein LCMAC201_05020 [Marseillevirus LCMAC201]